ncbi:hypothetical protein [Xylanimonas allomyrinae]|uniref:hypothetical protein n=1 Tax=Xylanimonas allomyrinae TaxID=2509459 RepID=UPI0013A623DA|nr:hypothetical protein [Xylanimonas allomyrinae]
MLDVVEVDAHQAADGPERFALRHLSVHQAGIFCSGAGPADYCALEFLGETTGTRPRRVPFWSDVVDGADEVQFWQVGAVAHERHRRSELQATTGSAPEPKTVQTPSWPRRSGQKD